MHLNRTLLNWGVFLVLLGAIPLAVRQGLLTDEQVGGAWALWPLLLIAAGIGLLLRRTRLEFAAGVLTAATLGVIAGGLIASGVGPFASCGDDRGTAAFPARQGEFGPKAEVSVSLSCGELTVRAAVGGGWRLEGRSDRSDGPRVVSSMAILAIESNDRPGLPFLGERDSWSLTLPAGPVIDLSAALNAGEARLDLTDANLGRLEVEVNAGQATIDLRSVAALGSFDLQVNAGELGVRLPDQGVRGSIGANAATVRLCPPSGTAFRVTVNGNITAANNFAERGLINSSENVWETPSFALAGVRLEIDADVNAGSINLDAAESCRA